MGRLGEVAIFLALSGLLRMLHGTRAQYNGPWDDFEDYDEREYGFVEDEEEDYKSIKKRTRNLNQNRKRHLETGKLQEPEC